MISVSTIRMIVLVSANILLAGILSAQSFDREVAGSAGQNLWGSNYTMIFTLGEVMAADYDQGISLQQGFHQEWAIVTSTSGNHQSMSLKVYPNPTPGELHVTNEAPIDLILVDGTGKIVHAQSLLEANNVIDVSHLPTAHYRLVASDNQGRHAVFTVLKLQ